MSTLTQAPSKPTLTKQFPGSERRSMPESSARPRSNKALTIGAVCKVLEQEFPDISISKIRYLENEKLLTPRRTPGGYRLYSTADVTRLRTILRLQRDEFLPLRVIRQELAAKRNEEAKAPSPSSQEVPEAPKPVRVSVQSKGGLHAAERVIDYSGASKELLKELEDFGIISGETRGGNQYYDDAEREIIKAVSELARYGVAARNLKIFRTSAEREVALLQQILAPGLRSRNPERRQEAVEALENLASVASHLKYLLLVRELRQLVK